MCNFSIFNFKIFERLWNPTGITQGLELRTIKIKDLTYAAENLGPKKIPAVVPFVAMRKKVPEVFATGTFKNFGCILDLYNIGGLFALGTLGHIELDRGAFFQRLVSFALNRGVMHEHISATFTGDESIAL